MGSYGARPEKLGRTFQRLMNYVFADYIEFFMEVYVDDVAVHSETLRAHL